MLTQSVTVMAPLPEGGRRICSDDALQFVAELEAEFGSRRLELLDRRAGRQARLDAGELPDFLEATESIRSGGWRVAPPPPDLRIRGCEITGPVDRKMMINALNSGATAFMADLEDSLSPTWENIVTGQSNLLDAVTGRLSLDLDGRRYTVSDHPALLFVRPRGWHLEERHLHLAGRPVSASLADVGLYCWNCAVPLTARQHGIYLYLPKLQSHREARLWNDVFEFIETRLGLPLGTVRATVLVENILAVFEMDEILYELRDHSAGLNAGRWDYIFSAIRAFRNDPTRLTPDRSAITMTVPFMAAYSRLLVATAHRRGAPAIGGMAAYIPSRRDPEANRVALEGVAADKARETREGFDGSWVAHPDLVPVAQRELSQRRAPADAAITVENTDAAHLLDIAASGGERTEQGLRTNIGVGIEYLAAWLTGRGAVGINSLMEDAATCEISRSQVWQWVHHSATLADSRVVTPELVRSIAAEEVTRLRRGLSNCQLSALDRGAELFLDIALRSDFTDFLTLPAYQLLD